MKLHDIVEAYVDYKHSLGMRFRSQAARYGGHRHRGGQA